MNYVSTLITINLPITLDINNPRLAFIAFDFVNAFNMTKKAPHFDEPHFSRLKIGLF